MPSLSDKLKALGVKVGAEELPVPRPRNPNTLENVLGGNAIQTPMGETFSVDAHYAADYQHGNTRFNDNPPITILSSWAQDARIREYPKQAFAFLDTETTGLSGGTGTYAFLIGVGRYEGESFHLAQFFMRDPFEEPALLAALENFLAPCQALVSYNGKAFDLPLLQTRYISHGWRPPFVEMAHIDLLHLARRLWRDRLPSRTLGNIEVQILGTQRTVDDIPGWMIPEMYFQYLRSGDASPLKSVFYHNAMDVLSLAALFNHSAQILADPFDNKIESGIDIISLARVFEDIGEIDLAIDLYHHGLDLQLPEPNLIDAIQRLASIHKHRDDYEHAVPLWEKAAGLKHLEAHVELAKFYEHHVRNYKEAIHWTRTAIELVVDSNLSTFERRHHLSELKHRLYRLEHKQTNILTTSEDSEAA